MAVGTTKTAQMVVPEVMADMINAALPKMIKFTSIAKVDDTLKGQAGNTIKVPSWEYIGDAKDVAEGAAIELTQMATSTAEFTIKKAGKGLEITDEAMLSGFGDPIGEAVRQLTTSIASKVDDDVVTALGTATLSVTDTNKISYAGIVNGVDKFIEESDVPKVLFIHPEQVTTLRTLPEFTDKNKYGGDVMVTGAIGNICGCEVVVSRRVPKSGGNFTNFMVQMGANSGEGMPDLPAVTIYMKRDAMVESDRDVIKNTTVITANEHYGVALTNKGRVLKMTFKA